MEAGRGRGGGCLHGSFTSLGRKYYTFQHSLLSLSSSSLFLSSFFPALHIPLPHFRYRFLLPIHPPLLRPCLHPLCHSSFMSTLSYYSLPLLPPPRPSFLFHLPGALLPSPISADNTPSFSPSFAPHLFVYFSALAAPSSSSHVLPLYRAQTFTCLWGPGIVSKE
jgi:hypothetical protein